MKFSARTIPAAAAMTAALMFGAQVHAQTATPPTTAAGDKAAMPAGPNTDPKTPAQRDAAKPMGKQGMGAGSTATGGNANTMGNQGAMGGSMSNSGAEQPVRQADKVAKNKAERMEKGSKQKSSMNKSNEPVRESDIKDMPTK